MWLHGALGKGSVAVVSIKGVYGCGVELVGTAAHKEAASIFYRIFHDMNWRPAGRQFMSWKIR